MDYKDTQAAISTVTYDKNKIEEPTNNIYQAISIIAKRANQINSSLHELYKTNFQKFVDYNVRDVVLLEKLEEFATYSDSLEEVFENKEQIEVSKFYERLPKPTALAVEEWLNGKVYFRTPETE